MLKASVEVQKANLVEDFLCQYTFRIEAIVNGRQHYF